MVTFFFAGAVSRSAYFKVTAAQAVPWAK